MAFTGPGGGAMNRSNRILLRTLAPVALMGVIFFLSAQPSSGDHPWWDAILRKLGHVGGYTLLAGLWIWALRGIVRRPVLVGVCISFAYACTDEFHQTFVRGRTGTPVDVGIDALGIALAAYLTELRRKPPHQQTEIDAEGREARSTLARSR
jgi:VanZ family protein